MTVVVIGAGIIDFYPDASPGTPAQRVERYIKHQGGAPANVARDLARLGTPSRYLAALGDDPFGHFIAEALAADGCDTRFVRFDPRARTGVTFISIAADGERSFLMVPTTTADSLLEPGELHHGALTGATALQTGTGYLIHPGCRDALLGLLDLARARDLLVCFDVNIRTRLWPNPDDILPATRRALPRVDLLKVSDEEVAGVLGRSGTPGELYADVRPRGVSHLIVTCGADGAHLFTPSFELRVDAPRVHALDTTGAGDAFVAGLLHALLARTPRDVLPRHHLHALDADAWRAILTFANAVGAEACTDYGATTAVTGPRSTRR